jgi:hypothetical protein
LGRPRCRRIAFQFFTASSHYWRLSPATIDLIGALVDDCIVMHITRRELLMMIGAVAASGCRGGGAPAKDVGPQSPESATVTLVVSGMV